MNQRLLALMCAGLCLTTASLNACATSIPAAETEAGPVMEAPPESTPLEGDMPVPETGPVPQPESTQNEEPTTGANAEEGPSDTSQMEAGGVDVQTECPETNPESTADETEGDVAAPLDETQDMTEDFLEDETEEWFWEEDGYTDDYGTFRDGGYFWDESWYLDDDFRFTRVDKKLALVMRRGGSYVYEEKDTASGRIGEIPYLGACCVLEDEKDGWVYIESGDVRGFIPKAAIREGNGASSLISLIGESAMTQGKVLCEKADNRAFTHTRTTSYAVMAARTCALSLGQGFVYEYPDTQSRHVGDLKSGSLVYLLVLDDDWYFVESGDVRGFVPGSSLLTGKSANDIVLDLGEANAPLAGELIGPRDNRSVYFTLTSVQSAGGDVADDICKMAVSFVGNLPYVYGGESLKDGCDCSGFVKSIYAAFGINLPRTAQQMGANGQEIDGVGNARPGDIIYYASGPHVGIYLGDGKVVQCSGNENNTSDNPGAGPRVCSVDYMPVTSIRRYLIIRERASGSAGHRTDDTPYTKEQLETIWAVVAQEDNGSYEGALAVISSAMNRTESSRWGYAGCNAYMQLTSPGQYCYSMDSYWVSRLHGNVPDYVKEAVNDCLKKGIRNHSYTSFRSRRGKVTGTAAVQIGGNWYFGN